MLEKRVLNLMFSLRMTYPVLTKRLMAQNLFFADSNQQNRVKIVVLNPQFWLNV